jgi:hypothetical protein
MPSSPTSVPDVLSLIGNAPVLHGAKTAIEKLRASKSTFPMFGGGDIGGMITQMMGGQMLQNPMAAISGQLQGVIGGLAGGLQGGSGMLAALTGSGGLQSVLGSLTGLAGGMSSPAGLLDIVAHAGLADTGATLPSAMGLSNLLAPLTSSPAIQSILSALPSAVAANNIGMVQGFTGQLQSIIDQHTNATTGADTVRMASAGVSSLFYGLSGDGPMNSVFQTMIVPGQLGAVMASIAASNKMMDDAKHAATASANSDGGRAF